MLKKSLSILLSLMLLMVFIPTTVFAQEWSGAVLNSLPTVTTEKSTIYPLVAFLRGSIADLGGEPIIDHGFEWGESDNNLDKKVSLGAKSDTGEFSSEITGYVSPTTICYRAYATTATGTVYGEIKRYSTLSVGKPDARNLMVTINQTCQLHLQAPQTGEIRTWHSDDETIATVTQSGLVTGVKLGTTKVTVDSSFYGPLAEYIVTITDSPVSTMCGDAGLNGMVDSFDATLVMRHVSRLAELTGQALINADVNLDGMIDAMDATLIICYTVGFIDRLPYLGELDENWQYIIIHASTVNGSFKTTPNDAIRAGDKITVTTSPDEGYITDSITVSGAPDVAVTKVSDNVYTFIMPVRSVTVSVIFSADKTTDETKTFQDIFPDVNLAKAVANVLGKDVTNTVTQAELNSITVLEANESGISSIEGIQNLKNLEILSLHSNSISDISILSGLINLTYLSLDSNSITDISGLTNLTNLDQLYLCANKISDISVLANLTDLRWLHLYNNDSISDISVLSGLTKLEGLYIHGNSIRDISPLAGLTKLEYLWLGNNPINDISALTGLINLKELDLGNVPYIGCQNSSINDFRPLAGLTKLIYLNLSNQMFFSNQKTFDNTIIGVDDNIINPINLINCTYSNGKFTIINTKLDTKFDLEVALANGAFSGSVIVKYAGKPIVGTYLPNKLPSSGTKGNAIEVKTMTGAVSQTMTSNKPSVITVNENTLEFNGAGSAKITIKYTLVNAKGKITTKTISKTITVISKVEGISLDKSSATISRKSKVTLKAAFIPSDATNKTIVWSVSPKGIATVTNKGVVTGVKGGTCTVRATTKDGGKIAEASITVTQIYPTAIKLNKSSVSLAKGKTFQLKATLAPSTTDFKTATYVSDNPDIATVDEKGKITAKQIPGSCTITATSVNGKVAYCKVTVLPQKVTSVKLANVLATQYVGAFLDLRVKLTVGPANADNKTVKWSSSNTKVAIVDENSGEVTFIAGGKVTIKATAQDGSKKSASKTFTVK